VPRTGPLSRIPELAARLAARPPRIEGDPDRPRAAVAIVLAPDPDSVLLIRRAERENDRWSGQLALPGGRWSEGDPDLAATARREAKEEVGVDLDAAPLIGVLDDLTPRTPVLPRIVVRPFVFTLPSKAPPVLNAEVAQAWWLPLDLFLSPGTYGQIDERHAGLVTIGPAYRLDVGVLWGMTERILTPLLELMR
jgi:8-oxo-dGTP pyrophosphatase MutT (NUDIX family)